VSALYDEIQQIRARYPEDRSAVMPALQLAQERNGGWLSEQSFRDVADALDVTPAFCLSIASFYDMFRLEPVGETVVEVCTNVSCGLKGAQQVVEAFEHELGIAAGETGDGFTLRTVECLGGCGWATIVAVNNRHRLHVQAGDVPRIVAELRGQEWVEPAAPESEEASADVDA
jgi:NADH-quinone oxidoreductase subunit E